MVWAATSVTFLATVVVLLSLVYALSASNTGVAERLTRLRHVPSETPAPHFWQEQKEVNPGLDIPKPPNYRGDLLIEKVRDSPYFFC